MTDRHEERSSFVVSDLPHYAILAPVPLEHLQSALDGGSDWKYVAFGTRKWELFRQVDAMRDGSRVAMLIYPSHEDENAKTSLVVSWFGWYVGCIDGIGGAHPEGMTFRPPSTALNPSDNKGHWAAFWHVAGLRELPKEKQMPIGKIEGFKGGWRKTAPPRGPELVTLPEKLSYEK
ncbi:MAG: hypothetical protein K2X72_38980 [Reyranella sp.]|nr:hypothetical protein [Reyranella sp.]